MTEPPRDFPSAPRCTCADFDPQVAKINGPIITAQARNPHLTKTLAFQFKAWRFCPWCGAKLSETDNG